MGMSDPLDVTVGKRGGNEIEFLERAGGSFKLEADAEKSEASIE